MRSDALAKIDASVIAAAKATEKTADIKNYEPEEVNTSITALGQDMFAQANAYKENLKAQANAKLGAGDVDTSAAVNAKVSEANRLLTLAFTQMSGWANEESKQGITTAHGPLPENDLLTELANVLDKESGAQDAVKGLVSSSAAVWARPAAL